MNYNANNINNQSNKENSNSLVEFLVEYMVNSVDAQYLDADFTLLLSAASTLRNLGVNISFDPYSDEDIVITNQVNARLREINLARYNGKTM